MKKNIYLMYSIMFLQGLVFYGPIATLYRQSRGISINQIFILESIFVVLMLLCEIPWGYFADRFGYKKTLLLSYFLFFISKVIFYAAHSYVMFLLEAVVIAIAISGASGCDSALIYSSINQDESEKTFSLYNAWGAAGFFVASLTSTIIVRFSMDLTALFTIIPYGIAFLLTFFLHDPNMKHEHKNSIMHSFKSVLKNKSILIFIISMALISDTTHSICIFLNQLQYFKSGISIKYFGFLTALMQITCMLSARSYKFSKKFGQGNLIISMFILITISTISLVYTSSAFLSIALIVLIEASFALCQPLSADIQNTSITIEQRATILSIYAMIGDLTSSVINIGIGAATQLSLEKGILFCGIISALGTVMVTAYFKHESLKSNKHQHQSI